MVMDFTKLDSDRVEMIFDNLLGIYGERWMSAYNLPADRDMHIKRWSIGLSGLTDDEIKIAIAHCKSFNYSNIPSPVEFYHYAKGIRYISQCKPKNTGMDKNKSREFIRHVLNKIQSRNVIRGTFTNEAQGKGCENGKTERENSELGGQDSIDGKPKPPL